MKRIRPEAVLVPILPEEAEALMHALNNSLTDPDFRQDHMTAAQRRHADSLAQLLDTLYPSPVNLRPDIVAHARIFVFGALNAALEMADFDPIMMGWTLADHESVLEEVRRVRALFMPARSKDRRDGERRKTDRRQKVDEQSPLQRTPKIRRTKPGRRYFTRRG